MSRVLIVDDDRFALAAFKRAFVSKGYSVETSVAGANAVEIAAEFMPDFILLDLYMGDHSGFDTCRDLKTDARTFDIPVIFVSGSDSQEDVIRSMHLGCIDYVNKPVNVTDLVDIVTRHSIVQKIRAAYKPMRNEMRKFLEKYDNDAV